jgi:hypothetical protein
MYDTWVAFHIIRYMYIDLFNMHDFSVAECSVIFRRLVTYLGVCDYRRDTDWILDLLTTCTHHSELHFTVHWHTQTSALSLLQSPLAVSWQRI